MSSNPFFEITLGESQEGPLLELLRVEIKRLYPDHLPSRAQMLKWFDHGLVTLQNRVIKDARYSVLKTHTARTFRVNGWSPELAAHASPDPEAARSVQVLYESSELFVINKPSGMPSVPLTPQELGTAVNVAMSLCPTLFELAKSHPSERLEAGLLHRLDNQTSGVLAFAKTIAAKAEVQTIWSTQDVTKTYIARITPTEITLKTLRKRIQSREPIVLSLTRDKSDPSKMRVLTDPTDLKSNAKNRGAPIPTHTELVDLRPSADGTFVTATLTIKTGAMHQIRVVLAHLGAPIVGDTQYGGLASNRIYLHHLSLCLERKNHSRLDIAAPPDFKVD